MVKCKLFIRYCAFGLNPTNTLLIQKVFGTTKLTPKYSFSQRRLIMHKAPCKKLTQSSQSTYLAKQGASACSIGLPSECKQKTQSSFCSIRKSTKSSQICRSETNTCPKQESSCSTIKSKTPCPSVSDACRITCPSRKKEGQKNKGQSGPSETDTCNCCPKQESSGCSAKKSKKSIQSCPSESESCNCCPKQEPSCPAKKSKKQICPSETDTCDCSKQKSSTCPGKKSKKTIQICPSETGSCNESGFGKSITLLLSSGTSIKVIQNCPSDSDTFECPPKQQQSTCSIKKSKKSNHNSEPEYYCLQKQQPANCSNEKSPLTFVCVKKNKQSNQNCEPDTYFCLPKPQPSTCFIGKSPCKRTQNSEPDTSSCLPKQEPPTCTFEPISKIIRFPKKKIILRKCIPEPPCRTIQLCEPELTCLSIPPPPCIPPPSCIQPPPCIQPPTCIRTRICQPSTVICQPQPCAPQPCAPQPCGYKPSTIICQPSAPQPCGYITSACMPPPQPCYTYTQPQCVMQPCVIRPMPQPSCNIIMAQPNVSTAQPNTAPCIIEIPQSCKLNPSQAMNRKP